MDGRSKKPLWPWIVATVVALPVLYVGSFGPACWLAVKHEVDFNEAFAAIYSPLWWMLYRRVPIAASGLASYATVGLSEGECFLVPPQPPRYPKSMVLP